LAPKLFVSLRIARLDDARRVGWQRSGAID